MVKHSLCCPIGNWFLWTLDSINTTFIIWCTQSNYSFEPIFFFGTTIRCTVVKFERRFIHCNLDIGFDCQVCKLVCCILNQMRLRSSLAKQRSHISGMQLLLSWQITTNNTSQLCQQVQRTRCFAVNLMTSIMLQDWLFIMWFDVLVQLFILCEHDSKLDIQSNTI